jgi:acetyltransferase-like isoleucine patch superfamily enzyme
MKIGRHSYGTATKLWESSGYQLTVGSFCSIASNLKVYLGGNHRTDWVTTFPFGHIHQQTFNKFNGTGHPSSSGGVTIGNDVWIGDNVTIMSGVNIQDGTVIANNSHVVKDCEPYSIIGGNPAKLIKYRFNQNQIEKLLKIKWWLWEDAKINDNVHLLCNTNIDAFINAHIT